MQVCALAADCRANQLHLALQPGSQNGGPVNKCLQFSATEALVIMLIALSEEGKWL